MTCYLIKAFTIGAIVIGALGFAHAQQSGFTKAESKTDEGVSVTDLGKYEYDSYCIACHGKTGKGDGSYALILERKITVPNLTELSKKNAGVFPFSRVYETIDGSREVQAHGTRDMPVWGRSFSAEAFGLNPFNPELFARAKILALTEYIYRLQAK